MGVQAINDQIGKVRAPKTIDGNRFRAIPPISRTIILVVKIVPGPEAIETHPILPRGYEGVLCHGMLARLIRPEVPLSDQLTTVARLLKHMSYRVVIGVQPQLVHYDPRGAGVLAGQQRSSKGRTDRRIRHKLPEIHPLLRQLVNIRRDGPLIPRIPDRLIAKLIRTQDQYIGRTPLR